MAIRSRDRGRLLHLSDISDVLTMPENTVRSRFHRGEMPFMWKLGRRLVAWEYDLVDWADQQKKATSKGGDQPSPDTTETPDAIQAGTIDR